MSDEKKGDIATGKTNKNVAQAQAVSELKLASVTGAEAGAIVQGRSKANRGFIGRILKPIWPSVVSRHVFDLRDHLDNDNSTTWANAQSVLPDDQWTHFAGRDFTSRLQQALFCTRQELDDLLDGGISVMTIYFNLKKHSKEEKAASWYKVHSKDKQVKLETQIFKKEPFKILFDRITIHDGRPLDVPFQLYNEGQGTQAKYFRIAWEECPDEDKKNGITFDHVKRAIEQRENPTAVPTYFLNPHNLYVQAAESSANPHDSSPAGLASHAKRKRLEEDRQDKELCKGEKPRVLFYLVCREQDVRVKPRVEWITDPVKIKQMLDDKEAKKANAELRYTAFINIDGIKMCLASDAKPWLIKYDRMAANRESIIENEFEKAGASGVDTNVKSDIKTNAQDAPKLLQSFQEHALKDVQVNEDDSDDDADERAEQASAGNRDGQRWKSRNETYKGSTFLVSLPQKSVRQCNSEAAVLAIYKLMNTSAEYSPRDFEYRDGWQKAILRLPIINIEDGILHPDSGVIGWMNIAACKRPYSWRPSTKLIHFTLSYSADLARIPIRETLPDAAKGQPLKYTDPVSWSSLFGQALKNKPQEVALLATLIARSDARGMKGDKLMCARFARLWYKRFVDKSPDGNMPCNSRQGLVKLWQRYNVSTAGHTLLETISDDWLKSDVLWYISAIDIHNEICMADDVLIELPTVREQIIDAYEKRSRAEIDAKAKRKAESKHSDAQSKQSDKRPKKLKAKSEKRPSEKPKTVSRTSKKSTPSAFKTYISKNKLEQQEQRKLEKEAKQAQKAEIKNQKNDSVLAKTRKNVGPKTAETICEYIWEYRSRWNRKKCMAFWPESSVQQSESKINNHLFDRICGPVDEKLNSIALNIIHAQSMIQCIREHSERSACSFTSECTGKMVDRALVWTRQVIDKHLADVIVKPADTTVDAIASTSTSAALAPMQMTLSQSLAMPLSTMASTHSAHQQYSYTWNPPKINPKRHIRNICYMARAEPFEAEITRNELVKDTTLTVQHKYTLYRNRDNMICIVCTSMDTRPNGTISFDDVCMVHASLYLDQKRETESKSQGHVAVVAVTAKKLKKPKSGSKKRKSEDKSLDSNSDAGSSNESDAQDSENDNDDDDGGVVSRMKKRRKESKKKANESKNKNSKHDLDNDDVDNDGDDKKRRGRGTKRKAETQPSSKRGKKKRIIAELDTETREQDIWDKYRKHYKTALCSSPFKVAEEWCPAPDTNKNGLANGQNDDDDNDDDNDKTHKKDKVANNSTTAGAKPSRRTKTVTADDLQKITMPSDIGLSKDLFGLDNINWKEDLIRLVRDFFIVQHPKIFESEPIKYQCAWYPEGGYTLGQGKGQILEIKAAYTTRRHEWTLTRGEDEIKFKLVNDKFAKNEEFTKKSMKRFLGIENPRMVDTPATGGVIGASDLSDMTIDSVTDHRLYDLLSQLQKQSKQFQPMHTNVMQFSKRPLLDSAVATTTKKSKSKTTMSTPSKGKPETKTNSDADSDNEDDDDDQENDSNDDDDDDEDIDTKLNGKVVKQSKPKPKAKVYELAPMPMEVTNKDDDDLKGKEQQLNVEAVLTQPKASEPNIGEITYVKQQSTYSRRYLGHLADQMVAVTTENPKQDCDYLLRWVFLLMRLAYHDMIMPSRGKLGYSKVIAAAINPLSAINIITPTSIEMTMTRHRLCPLALLVSTGILQCRRVDASERKRAGETSNGGKKYHIVSGSHVLTSQMVQLCSFIMERIKDQVAPAKAKKSKIADESKKNGKKKHSQKASKLENQDEYKIVCPEVYADLALDALLAQRKYKDTLETSCQIVYEKLRSVLSGSEKSVKFNRRRRGEKRLDKMPGPFDHDARLICMALFLPCGIFVPDTTDLLYEWKPLPRLSQQCIESLMDMVRNFEFRCRRSATLGGPITLAALDKPLPPLLTIGQRIAIRCTAVVDEKIVSELERQSLNEIHERLRKIYRSGHVENMNEYIGLLYCRVLKRLGGDQQDGKSAKGNMETSHGKIKNVHADSDDSEDDDSVEKKKKKQVKRDQTRSVEPRTLHTWQKQGLWWLLCCSLSNKAGGILGDDMGLGKTLQALCLVVAFQPLPFVRLNKRRGSVIVPGMDDSSSGDEHQEDGNGSNSDSNASGSEQDNDGDDNDKDSDNDVDVDIGKTLKRSLGGSREKKQPLVDVTLFERKWRPVLVVCPAINLLSPWLSEIVNPAIFGHLLACYIHHNDSCHIYLPQDGAPKKRKEKLITEPEDLERFDIIVTSYNTLAAEFKRGKSVLHAIDWHIVILDECTYIKNDATDMFKAVSHLNAAIRIAMSGTPSHGKPKDIHTLVKFLRIMPYSSSEWLKEYPKRYMEIHEIMLRRHKLAVIEARKRIIEPFVAMEPFEALVYRYSDLVRQQHLRDRHVPEHYIVHPREEEEAKVKTKAKGETKQIVSSSFASSQHSLPRIKQYDRHYVEQWQMRMINSCTSLLSWWRKPASSKDKNQPANILASWFKRDKKALKRLGKSGSKLAKNEAEDGIETKDMDETGTKESTNLEQTISKNTNETARLIILSELLAKFRGPTKIFFGKVASGLSLCGDTKMRQKCVTKLKLAPQLRDTGKLKYLEYVLDNLMQPSDVTEHTSIIYSSMSDKKIKAFFKQHRIISSDSAMDLLKSLLYAMFTSGENGNGVKKWFKRLQVSSTYGTHKLGNEEWTCIGQLIQCRIIDIKPVSITNCIQGITGAVSQERMVATLGTVRPNWNQPGVMAQFLYDLRSEAYKTMQLLNPGKQHNSNIMEDDDDEDAKNVDDDDDDDEGSDFRRRRNSLSSGAGSSSGLSLDIERFHNGGGGMGNGLMQRSKYSASRKTSTSKQKQDAAAKTKAKKNQFKLIGKRPGKQTVEMKRLDEIKKLVMPYNFEWETTHIAAELLRSIVNMPLLYPPHLQGEQEGVAITSTESRLVTSREKLVIFCSNQYTVALTELIIQERMSKLGYGYVVVNSQGAHGEVDQCTLAKDLLNRNTMWKRNLHRVFVKGFAYASKDVSNTIGHCAECLFKWQVAGQVGKAMAEEEFQSQERCRVFITTFGVAGHGITLTAGCNVLMMDRSWNPADYSQAEDRVFRIGQTRNTVWIMRPEMRLCGKGVPPLQTLLMDETKDEKKQDESNKTDGAADTLCDVACTLVPSAERHMVEIVKIRQRVQKNMVESGTKSVQVTTKDVQTLKQAAAEETLELKNAKNVNKAKKEKEKQKEKQKKKPKTSSKKTSDDMDTEDESD